MKKNVWKLVFISAFTVSIFACGDDEDPPKVNTAPTVQNLTLSQTTDVIFEQQIEAQITASDIDNETLTYTWTATGGSFLGAVTGNKVTWTAPKKVGTYTITCTVSDGKESVQSSNTVEVVGSFYFPFDKSSSAWGKGGNTEIAVSNGIATVSSNNTEQALLTYPVPSQPALPFSYKVKVAVNAANYMSIPDSKIASFYLFFTDIQGATEDYLRSVYFGIAPGSNKWMVKVGMKNPAGDMNYSTLDEQSGNIFTENDQYHTIGMAMTTTKELVVNINGNELYRANLSAYYGSFKLDRPSFNISSDLSLLLDNFYLTTDDTILK